MGEESGLFRSLSLGKRQLKNRLVFGPHRTNRAEKHVLSDWHALYYGERARGGAGLIIVEGCSVLPSDYPYERALNICEKGAPEGYEKVARAVRPYDCLLVAQLNHYGGQAVSGFSGRESWAPSPVPEVNSGEVPKVMEEEDMEALVAGFAAGSEKIIGAGLDGIEINAGQFSLLRQFLSPLTNFRTDSYGGAPENRARLCLETLKRVRRQIGGEIILGLRLCGDEYAPWGGLTPEQSGAIARYLCEHAALDYIAVEVGSIFTVHMTMASMRVPENYAVGPAQVIKKEVNVPVCATGSIAGGDLAEQVVRDGIDMVDMTRPLIADPQLPLKYREGLQQKIRPCILCNQGCYTHLITNPPLSCAMNPRAGRESDPSRKKISPPLWRKKVFVIGAGPAGLEAAASAAARGHQVVLFEKEPIPGGRLRWAARIPGNGGFPRAIDYLFRTARDHGVEFRMDRAFSLDTLEEEAPDAIVLATGSKPAPVSLDVDADARIFRPEEVLEDSSKIRGNLMVVDLEGSWPALGTAVALADQAESVHIVTSDFFVGAQLAAKGEFVRLYQEACRYGIKFIPQTEVTRIRGNSMEVRDKFSLEKWSIGGIDGMILAAPNVPQNDLYQGLLGRGIEVWTAGDCVAPRNYGAAVREGFEAGSRI